jgi:iron complex transport system ATP-binding protein
MRGARLSLHVAAFEQELGDMMLEIDHLACGYGRRAVLTDVNLAVGGGEFVCLLGSNGSGKTALLKTLAGLIPPLGGRVMLDGRAWAAWPARERARLLAYVPQAHAPVFSFKVRDVVVMGRTAQWPLWSGPTERDWRAAEAALRQVEMEAFADRLYTEISGGERQMTMIARALAQEARFLALDEPASSLDFGNQARVLQTLRRLVKAGIGVLMATHHPEHALRCASRVAIIRDGRMQRAGPPEAIVTAASLEEVYRVPFFVSELSCNQSNPIRVCAPQLD